MGRIDIACVCGYGLGTSMILKMTLDEMLADEGLEANVMPQDITSAAMLNVDLILSSEEFFDQLKQNNSAPVVAVTDFLDKELLKVVALPAIKELIG